MEKMKLEYSRDWRNPVDFPTIESDETKVRADMQALYTEIQTFLNETLIPAMETLEKPLIANLPVESTVSTSNEKIPTSFAVSKLFTSAGNLPTGGADGQFLVKTGETYAEAEWQTHVIPKRLSDLYADGANGQPVNAQAYVDDAIADIGADVADAKSSCAKNREGHAELIASGIFGFGTSDAPTYVVIELGDVSRYSHFFITFKRNLDGNDERKAALYLGRGTGEYKWNNHGDYFSATIVETGIMKLGELDTYGRNGTSTDKATNISGLRTVEVYPFDDDGKALVQYEAGAGSRSFYLVNSNVESNVLTLYARTHFYDNEDDGERVNQFEVYGIRRGAKEAE